eukprot:3461032-Pleurochrysis_carterae.AAC.3
MLRLCLRPDNLGCPAGFDYLQDLAITDAPLDQLLYRCEWQFLTSGASAEENGQAALNMSSLVNKGNAGKGMLAELRKKVDIRCAPRGGWARWLPWQAKGERVLAVAPRATPYTAAKGLDLLLASPQKGLRRHSKTQNHCDRLEVDMACAYR